IETEATVVDLLDYDVRFGQGFLFSPPRPVRAEALQGIATDPQESGRDAASSMAGGAAGTGNLGQLARAGMRRS
ncbi:MAG: EAL domain-containing protein, partial [Xanthobacteraceae bacterium]